MEINISEEQKGDVLILRLKGRLDAVGAPIAEKKLFDYVHQGKQKVVFNFSGVNYLSSAGMRMLLSTTKKMKSLAGKLVICGITETVMDALKMSGFDQVLDITKTEEDALRRF